MTIKEIFSKIFAKLVDRKTKKWLRDPVRTQMKIFRELIDKGKETRFGKDHEFKTITVYDAFKRLVPIRDYEGIADYINEIKGGERNVLWPGKPIYFCKSSGTTSGTKYLPITADSMPNHINSARNALLNYILETNNTELINGKMIFVQGSPVLETTNGIPTGRLSGIVAHHVPGYLQKNRLPSYETNCIDDWEEKVDAIVEETIRQDMTIIGGIPPWLQMYFEKLQDASGGKTIKEIFPNLGLIVMGGVNFEPYRKRFNQLLGGKVDFLETYPASEGFYAYQDRQDDKGLLLLLNEGIFYEFIRADEALQENPDRISIEDVELDVNYAIVINSNAGFWGYLIGDMIKFTSLKPHRIIVTGRIKHFISAFGEHVIAEEVESAVFEIIEAEKVDISEFTVAPKIQTPEGVLPSHEWFIEFKKAPQDIEAFGRKLDELIQRKNSYYRDLIEGKILQPLRIVQIEHGGFNLLMKEKGKLGGQNKMIHLCNDRSIADMIVKYRVE